ncbi:hypothetical protein CB0940_04656 [Cercospora beticola]|uniref:Uncharacterized protein n=1 Tax=Cercospora beticola TaxID=122368 RepID=A0A2G5HJX3_CERBT|nr:hypothetical protein CB0940_04656 [Cercospora beticola]PIA92522.1 hypothetical protein CB0940_04656 [Cercospora beticola]
MYQPAFESFSQRPKTATRRNQNALYTLIRDQLSVPTWLVLGGLLQGTAMAVLPYRNLTMVLPAVLFVANKLLRAVLMTIGVLPNPLMSNVIPYRVAPIIPSEKGQQDKPAEEQVCAIILGVVSHHPFGMFGPGFKEVGDRFDDMVDEMSQDATRHGFLGASAWVNAAERTSGRWIAKSDFTFESVSADERLQCAGNEFMSILYFENEHYLHQYAHGPLHTKAMQWWREVEVKIPYVGIMHEVFACPKRSWEGIYLNYQPTGECSLRKHLCGS